jgi:hypothetical protein
MINFESIIWYLFLLDALGANLFVWMGYGKGIQKKFKGFFKHFPLTKGWALMYLVLVLWVGSVLYRLGILP